MKQVGRRAAIRLWHTDTQQTLAVLKGHARGVSHVAFSPGHGHIISSVGLDVNHTVLLHDWKTGEVVARASGSKRKTLGLSMQPDGSG